LDSEFSAHVTSNLNCFTSSVSYSRADKLQVGDGKVLDIIHIGSTTLVTNSSPLVLTNLLHVSSISKSLLSISRPVSNNNVYVEFNASSYFIKDQLTQQVVLQGTLHDGLYILSPAPSSFQALSVEVSSLEI
jgi:hypothetical protein